MNCHESESLILAERDGALAKDQLAALTDHVASCASCRRQRLAVARALSAYKAGLGAVAVPDADEAWRELQNRLNKPAKKRPLAPVIWFAAPLVAAAAAVVLGFFTDPVSGSKLPAPGTALAAAVVPPLPYDPSAIAGADFVEAGDPNASTLVYVDKESGWLVVWATDADAATKG